MDKEERHIRQAMRFWIIFGIFIMTMIISAISCDRRREPQAPSEEPVFNVDYELDLRQDFIYVKSEGFIYVVQYGELEAFLMGDNL